MNQRTGKENKDTGNMQHAKREKATGIRGQETGSA
jgi:hypothetical protein